MAKLTLLVGLTITLLLSVLLTVGWFYWRKIRQNQIQAHLTAVAAHQRMIVRSQIDILRQRVELNSDRGEFRGFFFELANGQTSPQNRAGSLTSLARIANKKPILSASLVDRTGIVVLSSEPTHIGRDVSRWPIFKPSLTGTQMGTPHLQRDRFGMPQPQKNRFDAVLASPVRTRENPDRVYGVLLVIADVADLANAVQDVTGLGRTGEVLLGGQDQGQLRFFFPPRNAPLIETVSSDSAPALQAATSGADWFSRNLDYRGVPVFAVGRSIGYGGWGLVVKMDEKEAYAPLVKALRLSILASLFVAALGLVAAYFIAVRFTRPVRKLAGAAARVAGGDYETTVPVESADEFGTMAVAFNEMTAALGARSAERDRAEAALRESDRRKDQFLAVLSHELRNPLSAIAHAVQVVDASADDPHADQAAREVIGRQTQNLTRLVDDLLDVTRISEGRIELRKQPVEIGQAVLRAVEAIRPQADERRHTVDLVLASGGKLWIDADPARVDQILTNLLNNAVKYTPEGGRITVTERMEGRDAVITVCDSGVGIAADMLGKVFELFTQADCTLEHRTGGLGIGLNICQQLVELHGGSITAESDGPGRGAMFILRFPTIEAPPPAVPPAPKPRPAGVRRRILLVDDNLDTIYSMSRLLTLRGHDVATAVDGLVALKVARDFQPDFILLDIGLPGLDGYSLARRLRAEGFTHTPIVAVSGYSQQSDRARSREAGFDHHFAKPVDFEAIDDLIRQEPQPADQ